MPELMLFALAGSREFGEGIAQSLGLPLSLHEEREFEDGEHKIRPLVSVRGNDVFVIHTLHSDELHSVNDRLCRMLFFIGALKDASAGRVTAVVPYLAYSRKDRKSKARDPVTTRYIAALYEAVGTDAIITVDVHNLAAYQNAFRCRTEHLEAATLFASHLAPSLKECNAVVVSPDTGGIKRADRLRQCLAAELGKPIGAAFAEKYRSEGVVSGDLFVGDVRGKHAIIVDDLISTGNTLLRTARSCISEGAVQVTAVATHGLFVGAAEQVLADAAFCRVIVTDTVPAFRIHEAGPRAKLTQLSCAGMFADALRRMHGD